MQRSVYRVFGDESHDENWQSVFALAALFGADEDWYQIRDQWTSRIDGRVFHAADCERDSGDFAATSHPANLKLYADLTKLIASSRLVAFGSAMSLEHYDSFFPATNRNNAYYLCFRNVVIHFAKLARVVIPQGTVHFTFERKGEVEGHAKNLYNFVANMPGSDLHRAKRPRHTG